MQRRLAADAAAIQAQLDLVIGAFPAGPVTEGMGYATRGGKRIRGFLVMESARLHGVDAGAALWPACAIEALHAYSLVHDDLPAMDDDDLRRGQPTVHVNWDEATAVLVGDALHSLAFEMVSDPNTGLSAEVRAELTHTLARAAGGQGMVLGQARDIAAESADVPLTLDEITTLQEGKTGALIEWSATAGARMSRADPAPLLAYARALGLAFQIQDDVIDVTGDAAQVGKAVGKDAAAGKATFVSLLGLEGAKTRAATLVEIACDALSLYEARADSLRDLARFVISRQS
ncbi:farnesyl diphosphate synthase [Roseovarius sp. A-2]|uniref:polyprenyl synthetase family protein n=1 Tax=Roseovarius sp. A-2 TaxID=1570360 RepID=UPI0009B52813|nr:farnesyl diphosphate synthase [Roseovarius sp. A-2]GAW35111.1 farnesyl diphosphate synthase [Roseovarius sp. A-2]